MSISIYSYYQKDTILRKAISASVSGATKNKDAIKTKIAAGFFHGHSSCFLFTGAVLNTKYKKIHR
jgi:hypothetical protein